MERLLLELLTRLEVIGEEHEELYDTDVREAMGEPIFHGFLKSDPNHVPPNRYRMFSPEADAQIREALVAYITAAREQAPVHGITTFHGRLSAFQNQNVQSPGGNYYDDFFGWMDPKQFDESGNVI